MRLSEGLEVFRARLRQICLTTLQNYRIPEVLFIYLKPTKNAAQRNFIELESDSWELDLEKAHRNTRRRSDAAPAIELFVYLIPETLQTSNIRRATANRIASARQRIHAHSQALPENERPGPLLTHYSAIALARQTDEQSVQLPQSRAAQQMQNLDRMVASDAGNSNEAISSDSGEFSEHLAELKFYFPGHPVPFTVRVDVQSLRRAVNLPSVSQI